MRQVLEFQPNAAAQFDKRFGATLSLQRRR
jgi:hypothetical protein